MRDLAYGNRTRPHVSGTNDQSETLSVYLFHARALSFVAQNSANACAVDIFLSLPLSMVSDIQHLPKIFESKNIKRSFLRLSVGEKCFSPSEKRRIFGETRLSRKMEEQEAVKKCVRKVWYNIMRSGSIA